MKDIEMLASLMSISVLFHRYDRRLTFRRGWIERDAAEKKLGRYGLQCVCSSDPSARSGNTQFPTQFLTFSLANMIVHMQRMQHHLTVVGTTCHVKSKYDNNVQIGPLRP